MQPALVLGTTHATAKHESFDGQKLLIVQPVGVGGAADGPPLLAIDGLGCRKGDRVVLTSDGSYARVVTGNQHTPARWTVMGIDDE